mgnify:CR=1 FL=1
MKRRLVKNHRGDPLVNEFGYPVTIASGWYEQGRYPTQVQDSTMPYWEEGTVDWCEMEESSHWRRIITTARYIFSTAPALRGALMEQAGLSFPLRPQYIGEDKEWGDEAEEWLYNWRKTANVRGAPYDGEATSRVRMISRKVDGDVATHFELDKMTGLPRIRIIESHRIGDRELDGKKRVKKGKYRGYMCHNGVIHDDNGMVVAYHILGDTKDDDLDIPANELHLCFRPNHASQYRGMSELVASLMHFGDIKLLHSYELRAQQLQSAMAIAERNESGEPEPPGADFITEPTDGSTTAPSASGLVTRTYNAGMHVYFKSSNPANGLELLRPDRPGADSQAFGDKIMTEAFYGIEWDPNFAMAIKEPGGAWTRTIIEKIRRGVQNNQRLEAKQCQWEDVRALSWAVTEGLLPEPKDGDVFSWEYQGPPRITADTGYEEQANRESYKLGLNSLKDIKLADGKWWQDLRSQREMELVDLLERAQRISKAFPDVDIMTTMQMLEQRSSTFQGASKPAPTPGKPMMPGDNAEDPEDATEDDTEEEAVD